MPQSSKWSPFLGHPHQNSVSTSLPHSSYTRRPSHSSLFEQPNNICWEEKIMQLLIMYFSPLHCYLVIFTPKYLPQHPI
jgi:hypothetical protein